ncbi:hypothetical protein BGZ76_010705 [Entomortierella beljakovae]|nr:hypothetical protein BGZ76_010705 [Entomortierella beljakovae]
MAMDILVNIIQELAGFIMLNNRLKTPLSIHEFEEECLWKLLREKTMSIVVKTLKGERQQSIVIKFNRIDHLLEDQYSLDPGCQESLVRCVTGYPVFDFIVKRVFIQISIDTFKIHNTGTNQIDNAFVRPFMNDPQNRNQIEIYLDSVYGSGHQAIIDQSRKFIVTQNGIPVEDFHIVFVSKKLAPYKTLGEIYQDLLVGYLI